MSSDGLHLPLHYLARRQEPRRPFYSLAIIATLLIEYNIAALNYMVFVYETRLVQYFIIYNAFQGSYLFCDAFLV